MMMLALCFAVSAPTQNNKEDEEDIPDDPNHVENVFAIREDIRTDREMNKVYGMLIEIFDKSGIAKKRIVAAQKAASVLLRRRVPAFGVGSVQNRAVAR